MKKRFISFIIAAAIAAAPISVFADAVPKVVVDGSPILFADQDPVIVNERTLIPARGVFEAMGAKVDWNAGERRVDVTSEDNVTIVRLYIDDPVMEVYKYENSLFNLSKNEVTLEAAPQIMNDRTMIPLRAIGEALGAEVNWDKDSFTADITTDRQSEDPASDLLGVSLSASADTVEAGETFDLFVNVSNMAVYPGQAVVSVGADIELDKTAFELVSAELVNGDTVISGTIYDINPNYSESSSRVLAIMADSSDAARGDNKVMKITVRSLTGKEGSFRLCTGFLTSRHIYSTVIGLEDGSYNVTSVEGPYLNVDQTPVIINAGK